MSITDHELVRNTRAMTKPGKRLKSDKGERNSLAAVHRIKGVKEETVSAWLVEAAPQMEQIEEALHRDYKMSRAQLDALWTYVGHKGEKKGFQRKTTAAHSGAERRLTSIRDCGSGAQSPRPKQKSGKS
jgi:hypothetical protein